MLASTQLSYLLKFALPAIIIVWSITFFTNSSEAYTEVLRAFQNEKKLFITDFLKHEIDGSFDGLGIAQVCENNTWTNDLYLSCDSPAGGVGNVKNAHLTCIRLAIEMGAELILPGIIPRSDKDISALVPNAKAPIRGNEMDYFFDMEHLTTTLNRYCPQLRLHRSLDELWDVASLSTAIPLSIMDAGIQLVNTSIIQYPDSVGLLLRQYINKKSPPDQRKHPVRFNLRVTQWVWPTRSDGDLFARNFGRILQIRQDARRLAAAALFNMHKRFRLRLDPRTGIKSDSFVGVHLRTEKDITDKFPTYAEQAAYYLDYVAQSKSPVVFLATGASPQNITAFVERAKDFNVTTVMKKDILEDPEDRAALERFNYDQRALVDYEIMLRAGLMTGTSESPFAWNLALRRRNAYGETTTPMLTPESTHWSSNVQWKDKFSTIFGHSGTALIYQTTIWP